VTGSNALDLDAVGEMLPRIKQHVHIPVGVGFGIRDGQTAHAVAQMADAVIIGSKIIQLLEDQPHEKIVPLTIDFLRGVRKAMDA
jgi:tryptophan synthase alpha chain